MQPELLAAAEAILFGQRRRHLPGGARRGAGALRPGNGRPGGGAGGKVRPPDSGLKLLRLENRLQLCTKPAFSQAVERALAPVRKQTLTQAALETLCVVAYRQPVTRMEIETLRGVQCDRAVATLVAYGLIQEVGRRDTIGRPILYGTTEEFLRHFGLSSLEQLPEVENFSSLEGEERGQEER